MFPVLVDLGPLTIPTYGFLIALGFLIGIMVASRLAQGSGMRSDKIVNLGVVLLVSAILGAKLFMIMDNWSYYSTDLSRLFSLSALRSGGVFYGGLLSALAVAYYYTKSHKMPWLATADVLVPGVAFGHAIGRLGCFASGCCWGHETHVAWAVTFTNPSANSFTGVPLNVPLHPTQLYESFGSMLIGCFLLWRYVRPHATGTILGSYLVLYSVVRFNLEFFRENRARTLLIGDTISTTQLVALGLLIPGLWLLLKAIKSAPENEV